MQIRRLISIFFLFTLLVNMNFRLLVITDYCINTQAYSINCINKAKPELNCNGKCQMNKKIADVEKSDMANQQNSHTNTKKINLYNNDNPLTLIPELELNIVSVKDSKFLTAISSQFLSDIFKPPCA